MTRRWASPVGFPTPPSLQKIKSVLATALLLMNSLKSIEAEIPWHWSKVTDTNCWRGLEDATCNKNGIMWKYFEHFLHYLFPERIVKCVDQLKVELLESHTVEQKLHIVCLNKELISDHENLIGNYILIMFYLSFFCTCTMHIHAIGLWRRWVDLATAAIGVEQCQSIKFKPGAQPLREYDCHRSSAGLDFPGGNF